MSDLTIAAPIRTPWIRTMRPIMQDRGCDVRHAVIPPPTAPPDGMHGWGMLAACPALLDLASVETAHVPHLLSDLRRLQRHERDAPLPLILLDATNMAQHRLLASSAVVGVGAAHLSVDAILDVLAVLAGMTPADVIRPTWLGLIPPADQLLPSPDCVLVLAALALAPSVDVATAWCGLSRRTFFRVLAQMHSALSLTPIRSAPARYTFDIILHALSIS